MPFAQGCCASPVTTDFPFRFSALVISFLRHQCDAPADRTHRALIGERRFMSATNAELVDKSTAGILMLIAELQVLQATIGELQSKLASLLARVESELLHPLSPVAAIAVDASVNARAASDVVVADAMAAVHDRLELIKGMNATAIATLHGLGVTRFVDLAAFNTEDVRETGRLLGDPRRISKEGWIEQATLLDRGISTHYSRRVESGELASVVPLPKPLAGIAETPSPVDRSVERVVADQPISPEPGADIAPLLLGETATTVINLERHRISRARRFGHQAGARLAVAASLLLMMMAFGTQSPLIDHTPRSHFSFDGKSVQGLPDGVMAVVSGL